MSASTALSVDFGGAVSLALPLNLDGAQPRHFGAPPASSRPFIVGDFNGEVRRGASCNCRSVTIVPHCNGTHTEGVAHLTTDGPDVLDHVPLIPLPALVLSLAPVAVAQTAEDTLPAPQAGDRLVTQAALDAAWPTRLPFAPQVLVIRTRRDEDHRSQDDSDPNPPYLSRQAAQAIVARGIEHLVLDLPSADRTDDDGKLTAHRVYFGLPVGSTSRADATRAQCTITELARIPDSVPDGPCAVQLHLAPWSGDAVPSRPIYLPLKTR